MLTMIGDVLATPTAADQPRWRRSMGAMGSRALVAALLLVLPRVAEAEEARPAIRVTPTAAAGVWSFAQLIPSPLYVASSDRVGGGVRWQITPFVYSFGVAAKPVRAFVIEPVARHAGAFELFGSPEWACCAPDGHTSWIARGGARMYFPLLGRGEGLTGSLGGSYYRAGGGDGASLEAGIYVLFAMLGFTVTVSPRLAGREVISALHIRYF
ncbi:MAG TPA: hypothetical protein VK550_13405 [Polyangiaceae bacterium]|nr:hypothetical protein [Polyangiaceae bacterium]